MKASPRPGDRFKEMMQKPGDRFTKRRPLARREEKMSGLTETLADKLVFFLLTLAVYLQLNQSASAVVFIFVAVIASALASYLDRPPLQSGIALLFVGLCLPYPPLCVFLPLIVLDLYGSPWPWLAAVPAIPLVSHADRLGLSTVLGLALLILLAGYLHRRSASLASLHRHAHELRDAAQESALREASQRETLQEKQDAEIRLATLRERNRIAREIHDHVGHQLASAILQLGALMAVCRDAAFKPALDQLKTTLSDSMEQIRSSVHDLHDQSVDLEAEVRRLASGFQFCPLRLDYDISGQPEAPVRFALLAIIQEGLANIIRHSGASEAQLTLREHPGFYQLVLRDNGGRGHLPTAAAGTRMPETAGSSGSSGSSSSSGSPGPSGVGLSLPRSGGAGMGLRNIEERVAGLGGQVRFSRERGFTIFVTIPRENRAPARSPAAQDAKAAQTPAAKAGAAGAQAAQAETAGEGRAAP